MFAYLIFFLQKFRELEKGIPVTDKGGNKLGDSKNAAKAAITAVTFSRIGMAAPGMSTFDLYSKIFLIMTTLACLINVKNVLFANI